MKVTGGVLKLKDVLTLRNSQGEDSHEKVNQIRVYSGAKYDMVDHVTAGCVCAVPGLVNTYGRQGIGACPDGELPSLEPVLSYNVMYPTDVDAVTMVSKLRLLEEEDPQLQVQWNETAGEIYIKVMGQVQLEVVAQMVRDRFGIAITYGQGRISYKETIAAPVMGVGHFEPLRHYAEVHLLLEPMENGSGMCFDSICSEDVLDKNWQRLILTHLQEREFRGVLTGSPITDMKISITAGRAHQKHTEGGDFRQATYRAVRQGLMMAESVLLEPVYAFKIEVPQEYAGRVLADIVKMSGTMDDRPDKILTILAPLFAPRIVKTFSMTSIDHMLTLKSEDNAKTTKVKKEQLDPNFRYEDELLDEQISANFTKLFHELLDQLNKWGHLSLKEFNGILEVKFGKEIYDNKDYYSFLTHLAQKDRYSVDEILAKPDTMLEGMLVDHIERIKKVDEKTLYLEIRVVAADSVSPVRCMHRNSHWMRSEA